jgi:hypothetical protein
MANASELIGNPGVRLSGLNSVPSALLMMALLSSGTLQGSQSQPSCLKRGSPPVPSYQSPFGGQGPVGAESNEWRIELENWESLRPQLPSFVFRLKNKRSGAISHFKLGNEMHQLDEIDFVNDTRAVLFGRMAASSPIVVVVEVPSGRVQDRFSCFIPAISPNHRFVAFVKNFPGHPGPVEITYEYIVYDLTRSPEYNRPQFKPGVTYDAGWPVYPSGATNAVGENVLPQGAPYHSMTSRHLFWLNDQTLAFSDFFEGYNRLVVVNLSGGIKKASVHTVDLIASQFVDLERCQKSTAPSDFEVWSKEPAGLIHINQIEPAPNQPDKVCLYFDPGPCLRYVSFMTTLP